MMSLRERRKKERRKQWWKNTVFLAVTGVLAVIAVGCFCYAGVYYYKLNQGEDQFDKLRDTEQTEAVYPEETEVTEEPEGSFCETVYDFDELRAENKDIYAWITVPGTQVDYPVLQSETDNYYLDRNLDHSQGYPGCIYTNKVNAKDFSDYNVVLYGHNMKNGSMFGCLHSFEEREFFDENRQIIVYTEDRRLTYEIYAAVKFTDAYIPAYYEVTTPEGRDAFLQDLRKESGGSSVSHIREDMEILPEDRLITLSTCVNGERPKRYLVVGKLTEEAYYLSGGEENAVGTELKNEE